ncbi:MAG: hypothetical protein HYY40_00975 [Bacteroidetes bacterium]|nr:hypothetical protein [Bacteroidota bacterium]
MTRLSFSCRLAILCSLFFPVTGYSQQGDAETLIAKAKELYNERSDTNKLRQAANILEEANQKKADYQSLALLSHAYYFLGEKTEDTDAKLAIHDRGVNAGERALKLVNGDFAALSAEKKNYEEAIKKVNKDQIEALYWVAANLARWMKFNSFGKKVSTKPKVLALWNRVKELDSTYFYAGAFRFFGGYHALAPSITGDNDPVKAKNFFDIAMKTAPQYLETKVLCAEAYCCHAKIKDRDLFKKLISEVLATDLKQYPEIEAENRLAQEKAKKLLEKEGELFE